MPQPGRPADPFGPSEDQGLRSGTRRATRARPGRARAPPPARRAAHGRPVGGLQAQPLGHDGCVPADHGALPVVGVAEPARDAQGRGVVEEGVAAGAHRPQPAKARCRTAVRMSVPVPRPWCSRPSHDPVVTSRSTRKSRASSDCVPTTAPARRTTKSIRQSSGVHEAQPPSCQRRVRRARSSGRSRSTGTRTAWRPRRAPRARRPGTARRRPRGPRAQLDVPVGVGDGQAQGGERVQVGGQHPPDAVPGDPPAATGFPRVRTAGRTPSPAAGHRRTRSPRRSRAGRCRPAPGATSRRRA